MLGAHVGDAAGAVLEFVAKARITPRKASQLNCQDALTMQITDATITGHLPLPYLAPPVPAPVLEQPGLCVFLIANCAATIHVPVLIVSDPRVCVPFFGERGERQTKYA